MWRNGDSKMSKKYEWSTETNEITDEKYTWKKNNLTQKKHNVHQGETQAITKMRNTQDTIDDRQEEKERIKTKY